MEVRTGSLNVRRAAVDSGLCVFTRLDPALVTDPLCIVSLSKTTFKETGLYFILLYRRSLSLLCLPYKSQQNDKIDRVLY